MHWLLPILLLLLAMEAVVIAWGVWHGWDTESELLMASIWAIRLPAFSGFVWGAISLILIGMGMVQLRFFNRIPWGQSSCGRVVPSPAKGLIHGWLASATGSHGLECCNHAAAAHWIQSCF